MPTPVAAALRIARWLVLADLVLAVHLSNKSDGQDGCGDRVGRKVSESNRPPGQRICDNRGGSASVSSRTSEAVSYGQRGRNADVAQLVAHNLAKVGVAGSNPVIRSRGSISALRWSGRVVRQRPAKPCTRVRFPSPPRAISSAGERFPDTEEVTGSIPVSRTTVSAGQAPFRGCLSCWRELFVN